MIIVLFFDNKYFHFVKPLVKSISIKEPDVKIYAHTFNLSQEQSKELKGYPNLTFVEEQINFDSSISDKYDIGLNKGAPLRFQLTCQRGRYVLDAINRFPDHKLFIIMDVDTLVLNPLTTLKKQMKNYDVGVVWVGKEKIASGFFAVKNTERGRHYLKQFYDVAMDGRLFLCKDQKSMAKVYEDVKDKTNFLLIDRRYLDHACEADSFVWSGHKSQYGTKHEKIKLYEDVVKKLNNTDAIQKHIKKYRTKIYSKLKEEELEELRKKEMKMLNIDIGGSKNRRDMKGKWKIVDIAKSADYVVNLNKSPLPFENNEVDNIYTSHTLEHIEPDAIIQVFSEIHRVIKPKYGRIRIVVPDFKLAIKWYMNNEMDKIKDVRNPSRHPPLSETAMGYLSSWIYTPGHGHRIAYDFESLVYYLKRAGFKKIDRMSYKNCSDIFRGKDYKRYVDNSLFVETWKT